MAVGIDLTLASTKPKMPSKLEDAKAVEYVTLIYGGTDKVEAYKQVFPERYERIKQKAIADKRDVRKTAMYNIQVYESGKYVSSLLTIGSEHYFAQFIDKKTRLLNKMYDIAMDDNELMKNRLSASKIFLTTIPMPEQKITHKVEIDVADSFKAKLAERQKALYSIANEEAIIDAEVEVDE